MRIPQETERNPTEVKLDRASFQAWLAGGATNEEELERLKANLPIAMRDCLTEKQRMYIMDYFNRGISAKEIAEIYGVNKSTVTRTIHRGMNRLYSHLRFTSPSLANCQNNFRLRPKTNRIGDSKN